MDGRGYPETLLRPGAVCGHADLRPDPGLAPGSTARTCCSTRVACALAGHQGEETHQVAALAAGLAQSRESSIIGGDRLSLAGATLLNGYLITAVTMCDVHRATLTHITPEVIPPALAIAERDGSPAATCWSPWPPAARPTTRIGLGWDYPAARARGWHGPGIIGPFGAAAAVGRLLGFDDDTMARAFGLAGSQSAGTFAAWGTPTVKFHQCRGALSGLMAALLAQQKFVATREFLTAPDGGLYNTYSNGGKPEAAIDDLGKRWELENIALRLWPSASSIQGFDHRDVRPGGEAPLELRPGEEAARFHQQDRWWTCTGCSRATRASSRRCCRPTTARR